MTLYKLWLNACPHCGRDVARPLATQKANGFFVRCIPAYEGCGHSGPVAGGEGAAIDAWNHAASPAVAGAVA